MLEINSGENTFEVFMNTYSTDVKGLGTIIMPVVEEYEYHHLSSGEIGPLTLSKSELQDFLLMQQVPVRIKDKLHWSEDLDLDDIFN